ncbi:MAG: DAK2 domain-containing protein [Anaerolineaceae bacterium]|nr:DAK2 domain-containing protein [Anaerolineaceae bacterium]
MAGQNIDLAKLFGNVATTLDENKSTLNKADSYNHDHGDNMVQIFEVVTQAVKAKSNATPAEQLAYASELLQSKTQSGSAKLYAQGLQDASNKFSGQKAISAENGVQLLQALMGTQNKVAPETLKTQVKQSASQQAGADLLGSLLGGLGGASQNQADDAGDMLGSLLGGLVGGQQSATANNGAGDLLGSLLGGLAGGSGGDGLADGKLDVADLLTAGMSYMQAKQSGSTDLNALLSAVMAGSRMGSQDYRTQSGTLVANTLLQSLTKMKK